MADVIYTSDGRVKGKKLLGAEPWICHRKILGVDDGRTECGCENLFGRRFCSLCGAERGSKEALGENDVFAGADDAL